MVEIFTIPCGQATHRFPGVPSKKEKLVASLVEHPVVEGESLALFRGVVSMTYPQKLFHFLLANMDYDELAGLLKVNPDKGENFPK